MGSDNQLVELAHRLGWDCTGDEDAVTVDSMARLVAELEMRARQSVAPDMTVVDRLVAGLALEPPADAAAMLRALRGFAYRLELHARQQVADAGEAMWSVNYWMGREGAYAYFGSVIQRLLDGAPVDDFGQATDVPLPDAPEWHELRVTEAVAKSRASKTTTVVAKRPKSK